MIYSYIHSEKQELTYYTGMSYLQCPPLHSDNQDLNFRPLKLVCHSFIGHHNHTHSDNQDVKQFCDQCIIKCMMGMHRPGYFDCHYAPYIDVMGKFGTQNWHWFIYFTACGLICSIVTHSNKLWESM